MPMYSYRCNVCDHTETQSRDVNDRDRVERCIEQTRMGRRSFIMCHGSLERQLATISEPTILETADQYRNVKHRKDQDRRVRDRAKKFFKENEMEEMIEKAGVEQAKKFGWITKDGKKNKGD